MLPEQVKLQGAVAMKLLVIWRPDEPADKRLAMVERFVQGCRRAQLVSIIEPISRKPRDGRPWDWDAGVLSAANELGNCGADLYAEVNLEVLVAKPAQKKNGTPQWKLHASSRSAPPSYRALSRVRPNEQSARNATITDARGFRQSKKLEEARDWIPGTLPCLLAARSAPAVCPAATRRIRRAGRPSHRCRAPE